MNIVEPSAKDIENIINAMTDEDLNEIYCTNYFDDKSQLLTHLASNLVLKRCVLDTVLFGVKENSPGVCNVFSMATPNFHKNILEVTKYVKEVLFPSLYSVGYHRLQTSFVSASPMEKWAAKNLGGHRDGELPAFGKNKENFVVYSWVK